MRGSALAMASVLAALAGACGASRPPLGAAGPPVSVEAPVIVYGARWCQHTRAALEYFHAHNIPARFRDVDQDAEAMEEMMSRARESHVDAHGIPVLVVRNRMLVGYHPEEVERALQD